MSKITNALAEPSYFPIIIESLVFGKNSDYPLYIKSGNNFVLYRSKALIFSNNDALRLKNNGIEHLYIKSEDKERYDDDVIGHIDEIVNSRNLNFEEKAVRIYNYSKVYAEYVLTTGNIKENIKNIKKTVDTTIDYLLMNDCAFSNIINLSGYDHNEVSHGMNVSVYSISLATMLGFSNKVSLYKIGLAGLLHDIGKIKIKKELFAKRNLSEEEFLEIKKHPIYSKVILTENEMKDNEIINAVIEHHEASDGTGYPLNKLEEDISVFGKILIITNKFDSLTRNRTFRAKLSIPDALNQMNLNKNLYNSAFLKEFTYLITKKHQDNAKG